MSKISYVYPNVAGIRQRGDLLSRWELAKPLGCEYIEMPADFIKNKTESEKANLELCDFLTERAVEVLYEKCDTRLTANIKYILHSEPSLSRTDGYGISEQARLKWYSDKWVNKFTSMLIMIAKHIGHMPSRIEIHPGDRRNSYENVMDSVVYIQDQFNKTFNAIPVVLLENRTGQFISDGRSLKLLWDTTGNKYPSIVDTFGIVLDIQQLYTSTKNDFLDELEIIPLDSIKGFHIHANHRLPSLNNKIPWVEVFKWISKIEHPIFINPEIHHKNQVNDAINFCEDFLKNNRSSIATRAMKDIISQ